MFSFNEVYDTRGINPNLCTEGFCERSLYGILKTLKFKAIGCANSEVTAEVFLFWVDRLIV